MQKLNLKMKLVFVLRKGGHDLIKSCLGNCDRITSIKQRDNSFITFAKFSEKHVNTA